MKKDEEILLEDKQTDKLLEEVTTFKNYVDNPAGKGVNSMHMKWIKEAFEKSYKQIMNLHANTRIKHAVLKNTAGYMIYIKFPSEGIDKLFYDIVVQLYKNPDGSNANDSSAKNYGVRFFSNSPSFVFNYLYVYNQNNLFIKEFKNKFKQKTPFTTPPMVRNPYGVISYDKFFYYAIRYIEEEGLLDTDKLDKISKGVELSDFDKYIDIFEDKLNECKIKKKAQSVREKEDAGEALRAKNRRSLKKNQMKSTTAIGVKNTLNRNSSNKVVGKSKIKGKSKIRGKK